MQEKFLYFQPQYVGRFKCDGSKCNARCCRHWNVFIDAKTHEQYSRIKPESESAEILSHMTFFDERKGYLVMFNDDACPFLNENNLCRLQFKHGEKFLSVTCSTFPRRSLNFGNFFERSLVLTCPVAAELILFDDEPMRFEFVEVPEKLHTAGGKIEIAPVNTTEGFAEPILEMQIAMISILQERTLTLDQRLIVLGFFLDRIDELVSNRSVTLAELPELIDTLTKVVDAYESKKFLSEQVPRMLTAINFDARKFITLIMNLLETLYGDDELVKDRRFSVMLAETLGIVRDANQKISVDEVTANYLRLADKRKDFLTRRATFLENYLVNELFLTAFPWAHEMSITKNFGFFVAAYKLFELMLFAAEQHNFTAKEDFLTVTNWFVTPADHNNGFIKKFADCVPDDILATTETLLRP